MKATLPQVKKTKGSYISISATLHYSGTPLQAHVSAAKAGIDALSRVMAVEFGPHGISASTLLSATDLTVVQDRTLLHLDQLRGQKA